MLRTYTAPYALHVPIFQHDTRHFHVPHSAHLLARTELSPLSFSNEPQALGKTSVSPAKNLATASPELFAAVLTWNVRPCCSLRQWNLSWVKDRRDLSSRIRIWMFFCIWFFCSVFFFFLTFKKHKGFPLKLCCSIHSQNCRNKLITVLTSISCHVAKYF